MSRNLAKRIVPLFDRVLVQRIKAEEVTKSGIFIPQKAQQLLNEADVIAVGPGLRNKDGSLAPISVKTGDRVLLPPYGGSEVKIDQEEYLLFKDSELLAKIEN